MNILCTLACSQIKRKKIQNCDHHCCDQLIHSSSHGSDQFCSKRKHYGSGILGRIMESLEALYPASADPGSEFWGL